VSWRSIVLAALICIVAGCISSRVRHVYALNDAMDTSLDTKATAGRPELQLQRVLVPEYLDTTDILLRVGAHEIHESSSGHWSERLSLGIRNALRADLAVRLPRDAITLTEPAEESTRQIRVNVDAFDVWPNGHCVLVANWTILDTDHRAVVSTGRGTFMTAPVGSGNWRDGEVVSAMADALEQLAESIALAAKALPP